MKRLQVFFILCFSLIFDCEGQGNFDTIAFIQKWPVCKNKTLCPLKEWNDARFLTHAIVPFGKRNGQLSENCKDVYFDLDPLVELIDDLEFAWPDWPQDEDETVWEKDWRLHGSCTDGKIQGLSNENEFFKQAIEWYNKYDFTAKLQKAYIFPGMPTKAEMLIQAVRSGSKGQPSINCRITEGYEGSILSEIAVCFEAATLKPTGCGKLFGGSMGSCPQNGMIWWPNPIPQNVVKSSLSKLFLYEDNSEINVYSEKTNEDTKDQWMFVGSAMTLVLMGMLLMIVSIVGTFFITKRCYHKPEMAAYTRF